MRGKLTSSTVNSLFSPLIDVVFNAMAAMFIFLIIYIAIVPPPPEPTEQIIVGDPPAGAWFHDYDWGITTVAGIPTFGYEGTLPDGLAMNTRTGRISGRPYADDGQQKSSETFPLTVWVRDGKGNTAYNNIELKINPIAVPFDPNEQRLSFERRVQRLKDAMTGRDYHEVIGALGGIEPYHVIVSRGQLPPGLTIENTTISGRPTEPGQYTFTLSITDQLHKYDTLETAERTGLQQTYTLNVYEYQDLHINETITELRIGNPFSALYAVSGGHKPYSLALTYDGIVIRDASLQQHDTHIVLSGIPETAGRLNITVHVRDAEGLELRPSPAFSRPVYPALPEFRIVTGTLNNARVSEPYVVALAQEGGFEPVRWSVRGDLPDGLTLSANQIMGTPLRGGHYTFVLSVLDAQGNIATRQMVLDVRPPLPKLQFVN